MELLLSLFSHQQAVPLSIHNTFNSHDSINSLDSNISANTAANAAGHGHVNVNASSNMHEHAHAQTYGSNSISHDKSNNNNGNSSYSSNSNNSQGIYSNDHNGCRVKIGSLLMETGNLVSDRVELASNPPSPTPPEDATGRSSTIIMSALEFTGSKSEIETNPNEIGEIDTACCDNGIVSDTVLMDISSNEKPPTHHRVEFDTVNGLRHGLSVSEPMHTCESNDPVPTHPGVEHHSYTHPSPSPSSSLFTPMNTLPQLPTQLHLPSHTEHHPAQNIGPVSGQGQGQGGQVRPPRHTHMHSIPQLPVPPSSEVVECNTLTRSPLGGAGAGAGASNGTAAGKLQEALSKLRQVSCRHFVLCYVMLCYIILSPVPSCFVQLESRVFYSITC